MNMVTVFRIWDIAIKNCSTNFRGLPFNEEMVPPWLKRIWVHVETNASCCLLQEVYLQLFPNKSTEGSNQQK